MTKLQNRGKLVTREREDTGLCQLLRGQGGEKVMPQEERRGAAASTGEGRREHRAGDTEHAWRQERAMGSELCRGH